MATLITFVGGGPTATQLVEEDAEVVAAAIRSGREDTCRFTLRGGEVLFVNPVNIAFWHAYGGPDGTASVGP